MWRLLALFGLLSPRQRAAYLRAEAAHILERRRRSETALSVPEEIRRRLLIEEAERLEREEP